MNKSIVAIVGRPNVGKSTLFNRIAGRSIAIVEDLAGTTRDRVYTDVEWKDRAFVLVDTGGLEISSDDDIGKLVRLQVEVAIAEADVIIFLVDVTDSVTIPDKEIADLLRRSEKKVLLVVNKCDNWARRDHLAEYYELSVGEPVAISAHHAIGTTDLMDAVTAMLPGGGSQPEPPLDNMKIAIVGRPNVGKSMLLNAILGQERAIVSNVAGTTRDAIDTVVEYDGEQVVLIDTGGIRRRGRIDRGIEKYSVLRAMRAIDRADIAILVLDVSDLLAAQDLHIAGYVHEALKGMVVVVNKWDLSIDLGIEAPHLAQVVASKLKFFPDVPIIYTSALNGEGVLDVLKHAKKVYVERTKRFSTPQVNSVIKNALATHSPSTVKGRRLNVLYATQTEVNPPTFIFFVNDSKLLHFSYKRYLENKLRDAFGFKGTPLNLIFKNRGGK